MKKTNNSMCKSLMILTGGKSRRMGSDKSTLPFGRYSVIEYMINKMAPYFDHIYISAANKDQYEAIGLGTGTHHSDDRKNNIKYESPLDRNILEKIEIIPDVYADMGPIGGLYSVLLSAAGEGVCVTAVDTPFVDPVRLINMIPEDRLNTAYCIAKSGDRIQPLIGWYSASCLPVIRLMIEEHDGKMMHLLDSLNGKVLEALEKPVFDGCHIGEFFNMNDRACYYQALDTVRRMEIQIPVVSFAAWSGTGKTTYIEKLIPKLIKKGISVAVIKHDGHDFDIDVEGKDTYRFQKAGAVEVVISSKTKTARIRRQSGDLPLNQLAFDTKSVDLIIVEGYKYGVQPKIELYRKAVSGHLMENLQNRIALVSDTPWQVEVPVFRFDEMDAVCDFIIEKVIGQQSNDNKI